MGRRQTANPGPPVAAAVASLISPGLDQMLNGDVVTGAKWFGLYLVWWILSLVLSIVFVGFLIMLLIAVFHAGLAADAYLGPSQYRDE